MLDVKNIHFEYDREILHDVSFRLNQGEFLGIVGKSGGGKTSLLKILGGFLTPTKGQVFQNGKLLKNSNELLISGYENIALVHQDFGLDMYHTVAENIREKVLHLPRKLQDGLLVQMLSLLDLNELSDQQAISLSGGEQQRLSIARALASESDIVLLDEPFVHLDSKMRQRLFDYLQQLKQLRNASFIIVTHNGEELLGLTDEVVYIKKGKIKRIASPDKFYSKPKSVEEAEFFGHVNSITLDGKRCLFRPEQYSLNNEKGEKLELSFQNSNKRGPIYHNLFLSDRNEEVLLFSFESMELVNCVYV